MKWMNIEEFNIKGDITYLVCNDMGGICTAKGVVIISQNKLNEKRESIGMKGLNYKLIMEIPEPPKDN